MTSFFLRLLLAAIVVLALFAILPAFLHIVGFAVSGDLWTIIRGVVAVVAVLYVIMGPAVSNPFKSA